VPERPEIVSLLKKEYYACPAQGEELDKLEQELKQAAESFERAPDDVENLIMYGRRIAYLWRFREAISVFSDGIEKHPEEAMLYRHRGHRYINVREFENAARDLETATALEKNSFDIWYHLGLARWLLGDYERALDAYRACYEVTPEGENRVAIQYWLFLTLMRLGKKQQAEELLQSVIPNQTGENAHYCNILMLFRSERTEEEILEFSSRGGVDHVTLTFGLGMWHRLNGRERRALECFRHAVSGTHWPGFGFIAAEVELWRSAS